MLTVVYLVHEEQEEHNMSIRDAVKYCRKPLSHGCDREVFYSKKYNIIVKKQRSDSLDDDAMEQFANEKRIFEEMDSNENEIFPVIDIFDYKGRNVLLMKVCKPLSSYEVFRNKNFDCVETIDEAIEVSKKLGLDMSYVLRYADFIRKYELQDLHYGNVGVYENHLVIIDGGY